MKKQPRILVLGATGMLGRTVYRYLLIKFPRTTFGTSRSGKKPFLMLNAKNPKEIEPLLKKIGEVDYIINCIGILKRGNKKFDLNYTLPNHLDKLSEKFKFKLIHVSTDDVFAQNLGEVTERDKPTPQNPYSESKLKGETKSQNSLTIRTSFIGFDPNEHKGLIEWILQSRNKQIKGYENQIWSGCTTLQLAKLYENLLREKEFRNIRNKTNVVHFAPLGPLTKFELIKNISSVLRINTNIEKTESEEPISRSLTSVFFDKKNLDRYTTQVNSALRHLSKFEKKFLYEKT